MDPKHMEEISQMRRSKLQGGVPDGPARDPLSTLDSRRLL